MTGEASYGHDARLGRYKRWLERGAQVHGSLSAATTSQIEDLQDYLDHAAEDQATTFPKLLLAIHEVENAIHTLGITVALGALAIVGSLGEEIPDAPDLPRPGERPE